jgi:hypothetical protein
VSGGNYLKSIKKGNPIQLVKWRGNIPQLITGTYRGCAGGEWQIEIGGTIAGYDREEWMVCIP